MIDSGEYLFLAIGPDQEVTHFRSEIGQENLAALKDNLAHIRSSTTNDMQYQQALRQFQKHPFPPGRLLTWVCRDNLACLDLTIDRLEMVPAWPRGGIAPPAEDSARVAERRAIAELLDRKVNELVRAGIHDDFILLILMGQDSCPDLRLFKRLIDISREGGLTDLWEAYPGLHRFATQMELIAGGIQSGDVEVPP
jgi:hypothetical protein